MIKADMGFLHSQYAVDFNTATLTHREMINQNQQDHQHDGFFVVAIAVKEIVEQLFLGMETDPCLLQLQAKLSNAS
ncbi:MAG: hypothetical protein EXR84_10225 [Gammaproteobacteria bacterium]|nr:hypothetical protein [Gammaproteobacteria bacterium]